MKKIYAVTLSAALAAAFAAPAFAQGKKETGHAPFDAMDANKDGFLSRAELDANKELSNRFTKFDADKDGRWNVDEYLKASQDNDGRLIADTAITTKVKASLLAEKGIPSTAISVETYEGRVLLSGFVGSNDVKSKAGQIAKGINGVKQVDNNLVVK